MPSALVRPRTRNLGGMSSSSPRRPHSPAVYRRRRLMVLLLVVAVVAAIVWVFVAKPWQSSADTSADTAASASPSPSATAGTDAASTGSGDAATGAETGEPQPCQPAKIMVEPVVSQANYAADEDPTFSIRVTNTGEVDCTFNVGTTTQKYTVTSGEDTWWQSTDCQSEPSDALITLAAGADVTSATPLVWDRTRSSVATCGEPGRPAAPAGGASYHLSVEVGGVSSASTVQFALS